MTGIKIEELTAEQIPRNCFQHCPLKRFALVRIAESCLQCAHYCGCVEVNGKTTAFADRYRALCGYPTARQIVIVET